MSEHITLDGVRYVLRPSFAALSHIEQALDTGLIALSRRLAKGEMSLRELAVILDATLQDKPKNMEEALLRNGLAESFAAVADMLANLFEGGNAQTITREELVLLQEKFPDAIAPVAHARSS